MKLFRCLISLGLFLTLIRPEIRAQVQASLVSADSTVQPGHPLTVALRLVHDPHWHTYWLNPGTGIGDKPGLDPFPGLEDWGNPGGRRRRFLTDDQGNVTGNGYDGDLLLPLTLVPPATLAPGEKARLEAKASWLMCKDVCKPGEAGVSLTLPVSGDRLRPIRSGAPESPGRFGAFPAPTENGACPLRARGKPSPLRWLRLGSLRGIVRASSTFSPMTTWWRTICPRR